MSKQVQAKRGTATQNDALTGAVGEVTVDTTNDSLRVHDGSTAGGIQTMRVDMANYDGTRVTGTFNVTDLDVSGGATVGAASGITLATGSTAEASWTHVSATGESTISVGRSAGWGGDLNIVTDTLRRARFANNGDISFYEDTGTTAKFFWDASAEQLTVENLDVSGNAVVDGSLGVGGGSLGSNDALTVGANGSREYLTIDGTTLSKNAYLKIAANDNRRKAIAFESGGVVRGSIGVGDSDEGSATSLFFTAGNALGGSSPHVSIGSSGRVGIGTSSPATALDVVGTVTADGLDVSGNAVVDGKINFGGSSELTINSGAVTITGSYHQIDTESDASSDDLDTINGGSIGDIVILRPSSSSRTVVVKDATGNLNLAGDFSMGSAADLIVLMYQSFGWVELSRSDNAA